MVNLFDIVRQAQSGAGIDNLSRQFGLTNDQTMRAVEALLPAFTLGFQRSALDPNLFAQLLNMMTSTRFAPFYEAGLPGGSAGGQQVLDALFGPQASRQIAAQASAMSGIGAQVLQQMLPLVAAMLMGGLVKFTSLGGMSDLLRRWADWLESLRVDGRRSSGVGPDPYEAWADTMGAMFGLPRKPDPSPPSDPWSAFTQAMLGQAPAPSPPSSREPFEALARMFETGREVQAQHLANLHAIFAGLGGTGGRT